MALRRPGFLAAVCVPVGGRLALLTIVLRQETGLLDAGVDGLLQERIQASALAGHRAKVGKAIKDDPFVPGNAVVSGDRDARAHFPNSNMNP